MRNTIIYVKLKCHSCKPYIYKHMLKLVYSLHYTATHISKLQLSTKCQKKTAFIM